MPTVIPTTVRCRQTISRIESFVGCCRCCTGAGRGAGALGTIARLLPFPVITSSPATKKMPTAMGERHLTIWNARCNSENGELGGIVKDFGPSDPPKRSLSYQIRKVD